MTIQSLHELVNILQIISFISKVSVFQNLYSILISEYSLNILSNELKFFDWGMRIPCCCSDSSEYQQHLTFPNLRFPSWLINPNKHILIKILIKFMNEKSLWYFHFLKRILYFCVIRGAKATHKSSPEGANVKIVVGGCQASAFQSGWKRQL